MPLLLLLLLACPPLKEARPDADQDGVNVDEDCDDQNELIAQGKPELCDGLDNDCDGSADEDAADATTRFLDGDGDGFGDTTTGAATCPEVEGYADEGGDCDDSDASIAPGMDERCNGSDDDCDGETDESTAVDATMAWADADGDGHGDADSPETACTHAAGTATTDDDCDDQDASIAPGLPDLCDGTDQDCDLVIDEDAAFLTWYPDGDGDGYGDERIGLTRCEEEPGWVTRGGDCDDADTLISPDAPETCDGTDEDCDGLIDEDIGATLTVWPDADGDGYGDASGTSTLDCAVRPGFADNRGDCDDLDPTVSPAAIEYCDGFDDDCDGTADNAAVDAPTWYLDLDGDGYGDASRGHSDCTADPGDVGTAGDCDDTEPNVSPSGTERCDAAEVDEDCDGLVDDADSDVTENGPWYTDADGDGHGAGPGSLTCDPAAGLAADDADCDDNNAQLSPSATEICDGGTDEDCDGLVDLDDPSYSGSAIWYADLDADGWGDPATVIEACGQPADAVAGAGDCDDGRADVRPDAAELCDPVNTDEDCNGLADDNDPSVTGLLTWYADSDGDGYGAGAGILACEAPDGTRAAGDDCDDSDPTRVPGGEELCNDIDDDCDPSTGEDRRVTADGTTNYGTVQEALDAASFRVAICAGTWNEVLRLDGDLNVTGIGGPIIDASGLSGSTITVTAPGTAAISGLILQDGTGADHDGDSLSDGGNLALLSGSLVLDAVSFVSGRAHAGGGAWLGSGTSATLSSCIFETNEAAAEGGGLYVSAGGAVTSQDGRWSANAAEMGGALFLGSGATLSLVGEELRGNNAVYGGGAYVDELAVAALQDSGLYSNVATSGGGVFVADSASIDAERVDFEENTSAGQGGGLFAEQATVSLESCSFTANIADEGGGIATVGGNSIVQDSSVSLNQARNGAGYFASSSSTTPATVTLRTATFEGNDAAGDGGGLYLGTFAYLTASATMCTGNSANRGGGMWLASSSSAFLTGQDVDQNAAATGAGLFLDSSSYAELDGSAITENVASEVGGGVRLLGGATLSATTTRMGDPGVDDNSPDDVYDGSSWFWTGVADIWCSSGC